MLRRRLPGIIIYHVFRSPCPGQVRPDSRIPGHAREAFVVNKPDTVIEYGVPIDVQTMVAPPDVTELELEAGHPGEHDSGYIQRRKELFALCRTHRLERLGPPLIHYNSEETRIWHEVSPILDELHVKHASQIYLAAKRELNITSDEIPQLRILSERLVLATNIHLVPAEGALPYRTFYEYIGDRGFPVTQFIRHGSHPEFTPEPDMIHDCLGHVPPLMNRDYAELLTLIGKAVATTSKGDQVLALKRFSWFSIEFGLIEEGSDVKVFGAGILSSTGEIPYSLFSKEVTRKPFVTDVVIATDYDPSRMQDHMFIAPSFPFLRRELEALVRRFGIPVLEDQNENGMRFHPGNPERMVRDPRNQPHLVLRRIQAKHLPEHELDYVAINLFTGEYVFGRTPNAALKEFDKRWPDAASYVSAVVPRQGGI
jgi:phenylalanine-4-hydroxylase